ncbi:MAG: NAD-dependent protein deacylase [Lachnospiraceae bacterium]|jgi:NAD-dependent deacetylase|nr:NAD-dependent protein deacylase [Lachnospiraceae bacterium]
MDDKIIQLYEWISEASNIVFFGGAGVSTESGVPDFRSETGLYSAKEVYGYPPEYLISHTMLEKNPELFFKYYKENLVPKNVKPNKAHIALAKLEEKGKVKAVVTQNIDGLHQMAGSKNVYEVHGGNSRQYCRHCGEKYSLDYIFDEKNNKDGVPICKKCGGIVRPDVVLYEEMLDRDTVDGAVSAIAKADLLIVGGTSLAVYPAASFVNYFRGKHLVLINLSGTPYDKKADLCIHDKIGEVLGAYCDMK